jgi:hypothetical protein
MLGALVFWVGLLVSIGIGLSAFVVVTIAHFALDAGSRTIWWIAGLLCVFLYWFPYVWVHIGLRNRKNSAEFFSIEEARAYVSPSNPVLTPISTAWAVARSPRRRKFFIGPRDSGDCYSRMPSISTWLANPDPASA